MNKDQFIKKLSVVIAALLQLPGIRSSGLVKPPRLEAAEQHDENRILVGETTMAIQLTPGTKQLMLEDHDASSVANLCLFIGTTCRPIMALLHRA